MAKTVVGLFDNFTHAQKVVRELQDAGFPRDDVSLVANDSKGEYSKSLGGRTEDTADDAAEGAASGAGVGAVLGGIGGLLVGLGALAIPGIGPIVAAGPLAAALAGAGIGAVAGGLLGALINAGLPEEQAHAYAEGVRRGGTLVMVKTDDEEAQRASDIMNRHGAIDIDKRSSEWRTKENWTRFDENAETYGTSGMSSSGMSSSDRPKQTGYTSGQSLGSTESRDFDRTSNMDADRNRFRQGEDEATIPIIEEELRVGKETIEGGGVRADARMVEDEVTKDVTLREERVDVDRRAVNRPATESDLDAFKEGTWEVRERSERPIVDKEARVTEEVTIRKDVDERDETVRGTVRRTEVDIDNLSGSSRGMSGDYESFDTYDRDFRNHYNTSFSNRGYTYDQYRPAYQYGYELNRNDRFRDQDWSLIERDVRSDWERRHPDNAWDDFKDAVRAGWQQIRGRR